MTDSTKVPAHLATTPQFRALMRSCRDVLSGKFTQLYRAMLDGLDESSINVLDATHSDASRVRTLELIHEIQGRRLAIEQEFHHALVQDFHEFEQGARASRERKSTTDRIRQLSLVEKDELEITVEMTGIVANAHNRFSEQLYALNRRLAVVNGGVHPSEIRNDLPGGPMCLCEAFLASIASLNFAVESTLALFKIYQSRVVNQAGPIYDEFNALMVRAGVLPNLKFSLVNAGVYAHSERRFDEKEKKHKRRLSGKFSKESRSESSKQTTDSGPLKPSVPAFDASVHRIGDEELLLDLFRGISQILGKRRHGIGLSGGQIRPGYVGTVIPEGNYATNLQGLVQELTSLQQTSDAGFDQSVQNIHSIRQFFISQIKELSGILQRQEVATADADLIDLVGMLFEMILDDENLPDAVKALLSYLHTPFLKVAILDKQFFVRGQHPARRLLNALSQAGSLCHGSDAASHRIIAKMRDIVHRIVKNFEDNVELFSALLDEFNAFIENDLRGSKNIERRTIEAAEGRERLQSARRTVSREILARLSNRNLPGFFESFLMGPWANYLAITLLRVGEQSQEWLVLLESTDELIWSVDPVKNDDECKRLATRSPKILDAIKAAFEIGGDVEFDAKSALRNIEAYYHNLMTATANAEIQGTQLAEAADESGSPPFKQTIDSGESTEQRIEQLKRSAPKEWQEAISGDANSGAEIPISPDRQALLDSLQHLEFGTWFEFYDVSRDACTRGKLAWINKTTSKLLFVNLGGRQIAVRSLADFADDLEHGRARKIETESVPFVDKALKSIQEMLKAQS